MNQARIILRVCIVISLLLVFLSNFWDSEICYTCDPETLLCLTILHLMLLVSTFSVSRPMIVLAGVLLVFYVSRVSIIQLDPEYYTYYRTFPLTLSDMRDATFALLWIASGLLLGCFVGYYRLGGIRKYSGPFTIFPFEEKIKDLKSFYYLIVLIYILSKGTAIILLVTTGVGLPIGSQFFSSELRQALKAANFLAFLGAVPVAWFIVRRPSGLERKITIFAITVYVLGTLLSFSKAGLIYAVLTFLMVYYVAGKKFPQRLLFLGGSVVIIVAFFMDAVMGTLRIQLAAAFRGTGEISVGEAVSGIDYSSAILAFFSRVGSSFDVLSAVIKNEAEFLPFLNFTDELLDVVNGYVPGELVATDAPQFARLLPAILSGQNYDYLLIARTGENITLPGHLYLYLGVIGAAIICFIVLLLFAFLYRYSNSVFIKVLVIQVIFNDIPNGSGIVNLYGIFQTLAIIYLLISLHGLFVRSSGSTRIRHASVPNGLVSRSV